MGGSPGGSTERIRSGGLRRFVLAAATVALVAGGCGSLSAQAQAVPANPVANEVAAVGADVPLSAPATPAWQVAWVTPSVQLTGLAVFNANSVWVAGSDGVVYAWDGTGWHVRRVDDDILRMAAVSPTAAWVASDDGIRQWNGSKWTLTSHDGTVLALAAADGRHAWAATAAGIRAWDGSGWPLAYAADGTRFTGIAALDATHAWAVGTAPDGSGVVVAWDGSRWSLQATLPEPLSAVYASDAQNAWAVSPEGSIYEWNGTAWDLTVDLHLALNGVAGTNASHVWVTADSGQVLFHDGATWHVQYQAPTTVSAVAAADPGDVWAIGFDTVYSTVASAADSASSASSGTSTAPGF